MSLKEERLDRVWRRKMRRKKREKVKRRDEREVQRVDRAAAIKAPHPALTSLSVFASLAFTPSRPHLPVTMLYWEGRNPSEEACAAED
jgi:hypothetical protein